VTSTDTVHPISGQPEPEHQDGPRSGWMTITPAKAQEILDRRNTHNRTLLPSVIDGYARDMAKGNWLLNGDAIRFAVDGALLDGQHRLAAVVRSGIGLRTAVVWNLPPEVQATMDDGRKRSMADVLVLEGRKVSPVTTAAVVRRLIWWDSGTRGAVRAGRPPTKQEMADYLALHPLVYRAAEKADATRSGRMVRAPASTLGLAYVLFARLSQDHADEFFARLRDGAGLDIDSPILTLRNRLAADNATRLDAETPHTLAYVIKAWNAWRDGRRVRLLRYKANEQFPEPV